MIIYRCNIDNTDIGMMVSWHPSYAAARRHWLTLGPALHGVGWSYPPISSILRGYDWSDGRIEQCEIEPTKKDLLAWLNEYCQTDNQ